MTCHTYRAHHLRHHDVKYLSMNTLLDASRPKKSAKLIFRLPLPGDLVRSLLV